MDLLMILLEKEMQYQPSMPLEDLKDPFNQINQKYDKLIQLNQSISLFIKKIKVETNKLNIFYLKSFLE